MASENILKLRMFGLVGLAILFYPYVFLLALLTQIYKLIFPRKCKNVAGEVAVVTGGAHGLGKSISIELAQKGCQLAIVDINSELAEETAKYINETYKVKAKAYKVDVSNYLEVEQLNEKVTSDLGPTTILINNAGILYCKDLINPDWQDIQRMINVNLTAHFWTNRVFLPKMKELKRGHIVAISSVAGFFPLMHSAPYTSTKFAVRGLMRVLRQELSFGNFKNLHATTVFPSFLQTNETVVKIVKALRVDKIYPLISGEKAAQRIVRGMLQNEEEIVIPGFAALLYRLFEILPASWQDFILVAPNKIPVPSIAKTNKYIASSKNVK